MDSIKRGHSFTTDKGWSVSSHPDTNEPPFVVYTVAHEEAGLSYKVKVDHRIPWEMFSVYAMNGIIEAMQKGEIARAGGGKDWTS